VRDGVHPAIRRRGGVSLGPPSAIEALEQAIAHGAEWIRLPDHLDALRRADERFEKERDQRYAEVKAEQEKALVIKDTANRDALALARQDQTYKDEQANKLREQINSERGLYATKDDLSNAVRELLTTVKPLGDYVSSQQGFTGGESAYRTERRLTNGQTIAIIVAVMAALSFVLTVIAGVVGVVIAFHG
jgi:hypothetical protein